MENQEKEHVRRVRYRGTHPRKFKEKYKELQPEKYADDVAQIINNGKTPAGMHISICVNEILEFLQIKPGQIGLDATLGYGGHTQEMLKCLDNKGHLYAIDVDSIELRKTAKRLEDLGFGPEILTIKQINFANIDKIMEEGKKFDFVLADLGVSSMQIDNPERGFSFKYDGPLDLRLNPKEGLTASKRLKNLSEAAIESMLLENSDEPYARQIAHSIISVIRSGKEIETTKQLANIISNSLSFIPANDRKSAIKKSCQRTFQALRIDVNKEFEVLYEFLDKLPYVLAKDGRVAILTFHSGEDRLVKKSFKQYFNEGLYNELFNCRYEVNRSIRDNKDKWDTSFLENTAAKLKDAIGSVKECNSMEELRGIEGDAARQYFSSFDYMIIQQKDDFIFSGRTKRPPLDNVNALLSFGYSLLAHDVEAALLSVGLDPYVGFMHTDRPGRISLALDIMEEFRASIVDRFVLTLINLKQINATHFMRKESEGILMTDDARKVFLTEWQKRKQEHFNHGFMEEKMKGGLLPYAQSLILSRYLRGEINDYVPYFKR